MTRPFVIVLDEAAVQLVGAYDRGGVRVVPVATWGELVRIIAEFESDPVAAVIDLSIPDAPSALAMVHTISAFVPRCRIVLGSGHPDLARIAGECGAIALPKPYGLAAFWSACGLVPASTRPPPQEPSC